MSGLDREQVASILEDAAKCGLEIGLKKGLEVALVAIQHSATLEEAKDRVLAEFGKVSERLQKAREHLELECNCQGRIWPPRQPGEHDADCRSQKGARP